MSLCFPTGSYDGILCPKHCAKVADPFLGNTLNKVNEELGRKKDEQKEGTPVIWYPGDTDTENKREKRIAYNDAHVESHIQRHTPKHWVVVILQLLHGPNNR